MNETGKIKNVLYTPLSQLLQISKKCCHIIRKPRSILTIKRLKRQNKINSVMHMSLFGDQNLNCFGNRNELHKAINVHLMF